MAKNCLCVRLLLAAIGVVMTSIAAAKTAADCTAETDATNRLACYDHLFLNTAPKVTGGESPTTAEPLLSPKPRMAAGDANKQTVDVSSALTTFWELAPADKRGTFIVRTYLPNFVLPLHFTSSINRAPSSPNQPVSADKNNYKPLDAKLQISLRAKVMENFLLPNADLWFAYTQQSFLQVWDRRDSAPFRSTDYQPEAIYVLPVPAQIGKLPGGWNLRMVQIGLAHQSNGLSNPLSRSWNRLYASAALERGEIELQVRANHRVRGAGSDDNSDLARYVGNTEIMLSWLPGRSTAMLTWRTGVESLRRGSLQLDWTYPVNSDKPQGMRWFAQLFTGYGETLLDYNHRQTSFGIGLTLFQF